MNQKLWTKLLAAILVMTLTITNFIYLGVYASDSYGASDSLERQETVTNNTNVTFDAYFKDDKGNDVHTIRENMSKENLKLYVAVEVKKGYLKNASLQVIGENKTNSNLKLKNSNEDLEYIQSIDEQTNTIYLKQVNSGTQVILEVPVVAVKDDYYDIANFSKLNDIVLTGNHIGDNGQKSKIEKSIQVRNEWTHEANATLEQQLLRFIPYEVNNERGTILQTLVKSGIANNTLPVQENNIVIEVPVVNGKKPTSVNVTTNGILQTNGKTILKEDWNYSEDTGIVTIRVTNEPIENKIAWLKQGQDEFVVTYLYDEKVDTLETVLKTASNMKVYNIVETNLLANHELTISQNEVLGQIVSGTIQTTEVLSKGSLYNKVQKETTYGETVSIDVSNPELVDEITVKQDMDYFVNEVGEMTQTTVANNNYAHYKTTKISEENFKALLGQEGSIKIVTLAGEELVTWNKETKADENGDYVFNYGKETNQIKIITSKPIVTGKLEIRHEKVLKGNTDYSRNQVESFKTLKVAANVEAKMGEVVISNTEVAKEISLVAPVTKIESGVTNANLSTVVTNENVELRVILKTNDITCDLYKNPKVEIVLPSYIEKVNIKDLNLLFCNELTIKDYNTYVNENGNTVIRVDISGEQTSYSEDDITKGANLIINTDITIKQLTPTKDDVMKVYVTNEIVTSYEQVEQTRARTVEQRGYSQTTLKAVAPVGMVATSTISNYNAKNETITSVGSVEQIGKLDVKKEARTANVSMSIINNYQNSVNNVMVLGRVPTEGTKNVDTLENYNSNLALTMASVINGSGLEASSIEIYYSTNGEASKDLSVSSNGWTKTPENLASVKSYLIVVNGNMATGSILNITYNLSIPENISYHMGAYNNYVVYFDNLTTEGTVPEKTVAAKVGLETGEGPELEVSIHSDKEGKEVQEGEIITYTVSVKNIGKSEVKNVIVSGNIPEKTVYTYEEMAEGEGASQIRKYDTQMKIYSKIIETIPIGETKTLIYQVEAGDLSVGYDQNGNIETIEDYTIQNSAKVVVEGYDIDFTSKTLENKLIQGYVRVRMEVATIPAEYARQEGDEVTYVIYVENANAIEKKKITLKTTLPEGVTYIGSTGFGNYDESTRQLTWNIETLDPNKILRYQFGVTVDSLQKDIYEKTISTRAYLEGEKQVESNEVSVTVKKAKLAITQSSDTKSQVYEGDTIIYNFNIKNEGMGEAPSVELVDELPEGLEYEEAQYSYNGNTYTSKLSEANTVRIKIGGLKPGETLAVSLKTVARKLENGADKKQVVNKGVVSAEGVEAVVSNEIAHTILRNTNNPSKDPSTDVPEEGTHSISGIAWLDANGDGKRDEQEQRMANIPVILVDTENGKIVKDITTGKEKKQNTDANGEYIFTNLKLGNYMVVFLYDSGNYGITHYKKQGINDNQNSDAVQMNIIYEGVTRVGAVSDKLTLGSQNITNIDIGLITSPKFDLKLDKMVSAITVSDVNGTDIYEYKDEKTAKLDLNSKTAIGSTVMIEYKIKVTNEGGVAGYAKKIVDYLPNDMKFTSELNKDWYTADNGTNLYNTSLANTLIRPGETKEVTLLLTRKITDSNMGIVNNTAEIAESYNDLGLADHDSTVFNKVQNEDDMSSADVIIGIKTGEVYLYILLTITAITLLGVGIYFINKKVLKRQ